MAASEKVILEIMRKVLAEVVKDTLPAEGMKHPLKDTTIQDIRACFGLIAARERELMEDAGVPESRPKFIDEKSAPVISLEGLLSSSSKN